MPLKIVIGVVGGTIAAVIVFLISPRTFSSLIIGTVGFTMVWKTVWWISTFGRVPWAEKHLTSGLGSGSGGSWFFYKLLGIVIIIGAILYWTGSLERIFISLAGGFFPR